MAWLQLKFSVAEANSDTLSDILSQAGAASVTLQDAADQPLYEPPPGATPLWSQTQVIGLFAGDCDTDEILQFVRNALDPQPLPKWQWLPLEDKDWQHEWMKHFHPMQFGQRLWICPSWTKPPQSDAVNILLDPGLAFGTGTHATTSLCLQWLDAHILGGETLIDYGCGSGILALAALKLGAQQVWAIDNDPQAMTATKNNAKKNGVTTGLNIDSPEDPIPETVDIVVANILANPLLQLAPTFAKLLKPQGHIVLSGILQDQAEHLLQRYSQWFCFDAPRLQEDWACLHGRKR